MSIRSGYKVKQMDSNTVIETKAQSDADNACLTEPSFVLLFSIHLNTPFKGFGTLPSTITPLSTEQSTNYAKRLSEFEIHLLGKTFYDKRRLVRTPLGRISLDKQAVNNPSHADVYLLTHKSGVALWEVWISASSQIFDVPRWIDWLDAESETSLVMQVWQVLGVINEKITGKTSWSGQYFPITLLKMQNVPLEHVIDIHANELISLLFLDHSRKPLKAKVVAEELSRDYCMRESGLTLLGRRSGLDVRVYDEAEKRDTTQPPPKSSLPFLITLELLLLERMVLVHLYERLSRRIPQSIEELLTLKHQAMDALEEYSGAITNATQFSDAVTIDGERLLGLSDLYAALTERLETVSFTITTRYQNQMSLLGFWLTIVFGATEIGFIASGIAVWYYPTELLAVLGWTVVPTLLSALILWLMLRKKV